MKKKKWPKWWIRCAKEAQTLSERWREKRDEEKRLRNRVGTIGGNPIRKMFKKKRNRGEKKETALTFLETS